jgi:hypothetical protein
MNVARASVNRHDSVGKSYKGGCNVIPNNLVTLSTSSLASTLILWLLSYPSKPWEKHHISSCKPTPPTHLMAKGGSGQRGRHHKRRLPMQCSQQEAVASAEDFRIHTPPDIRAKLELARLCSTRPNPCLGCRN